MDKAALSQGLYRYVEQLTGCDRTSDDWFAQLLDDMMAPFPGQRPLNADVLLERLAHPAPPQIAKNLSKATEDNTPVR